MQALVWVVMGNDYPAGIFSSEDKANAYIVAAKKRDKDIHGQERRIYWRAHQFVLDQGE